MNETLLGKISIEALRSAYAKKGYAFFEKGSYNLNIFGVRSVAQVADAWDDVIGICYRDNQGEWLLRKYEATTDPGAYWLKNLMQPKGAAILVEGQYKGAYELGFHYGTEALLQIKPVRCYRDANKDAILNKDPKSITEGLYGINVHSTGAKFNQYRGYTPENVDKWSAGCQVIRKSWDMYDFMGLIKMSAKIYGDRFTYTLLHENDL